MSIVTVRDKKNNWRKKTQKKNKERKGERGVANDSVVRLSYKHFHNILRFLDVLNNFLSPQVKRSTIVTYKHGINELPHELPN